MPLRVAFDLDGVLADMESELVRQAVSLFGEKVTRQPPEPAAAVPALDGVTPDNAPIGWTAPAGDGALPAGTAPAAPDDVPPLLELNMTGPQQRRLWRQVRTIDNFWETLEECEPGMIARLAAVAAERRWEVIFLTKRPASAGATAQVQTQRWLAAHGFALPSVFVVQRSRGRIAASLELDVVIDDRPENCLDVVVDSKARPILVWRPDRSLLPAATERLGIAVVATVAQCLDALIELDQPPGHPPGMIGRVRRMLGMKEAVNS